MFQNAHNKFHAYYCEKLAISIHNLYHIVSGKICLKRLHKENSLVALFFLFSFWFGDHIQKCSGNTPGSELRGQCRVPGIKPWLGSCKANSLIIVQSHWFSNFYFSEHNVNSQKRYQNYQKPLSVNLRLNCRALVAFYKTINMKYRTCPVKQILKTYFVLESLEGTKDTRLNTYLFLSMIINNSMKKITYGWCYPYTMVKLYDYRRTD